MDGQPATAGGFAINPAFDTERLSRRGLPTLEELMSFGVTTGGVFSGGSPPTQLDIGQTWFFNDATPFNLIVRDFDYDLLPVESSWDLGLGDISNFELLFGPYFARHPEVFLMWAWHSAGGNIPPSFIASTSTPDQLPRDLFPFDTFGDLIEFDTVITGNPNIGDGVVGWTISGTVTTAGGTGINDYAGPARPEEPLSAFDGEPKGGTWSLMVIDHAADDIGVLENFSLHFTNESQPLTYQDLTLPAGFLGLGCDSFDARVEFKGDPIDPARLGDADTCMQRSADPVGRDDPVGAEGTVDLEIVELSLKSVDPITVTCNGQPEQWDVRASLSPTAPPTGTFTARKTHDNGGTFDTDFNVQPLLTFTNVNDPSQEVTLDTAEQVDELIHFTSTGTPFVYQVDDSLGIVSEPNAQMILGVEETVPGDTSSQEPRVLTEEEQLARHTVCPPTRKKFDHWSTWTDDETDDATYQDVTLPAGFFGDGCDAFDDRIEFVGDPLNPAQTGDADTLILRLEDPVQPNDLPGSAGTVEIEIVELNLVSRGAITVTCDGQDEQWIVRATLSDTKPADTGSMTATKSHANGGSFDSTLFVQPLLKFIKVDNPGEVRTLDTAEAGFDPIEFTAEDVPFVHEVDPSLDVVTAPGSQFVAGVEETVPGNTTSQVARVVTEEALLAKHTVCIAIKCTVDLGIDSNNNGRVFTDIPNDDPIEEDAPGKFICVNDDDDNNNGTPDKDDAPGTTNENDLVAIVMSTTCSTEGRQWQLTFPNKVKIWEFSNRTNGSFPPVESGQARDFPMPGVCWVEGISPSTSAGDVEIELAVVPAGGGAAVAQDKVKATVVKAAIATPNGDPTTTAGANAGNERTYSAAAADPTVTVPCVAEATHDADKLRWKIQDVGTIKAKWNPHVAGDEFTGKGLNSTATFTGLPPNNNDFGAKTITLTMAGVAGCEDTQVVEIFFNKTATNHPGGQAGSPNWYHYWRQATGTAANLTYGGAGAGPYGEVKSFTGWAYAVVLPTKTQIHIYDLAATTDPGDPLNNIHGQRATTGIAVFWDTVKHESVHVIQIANADALVAVAPGTPWANGWSWNAVGNDNHWGIGADGVPGVPTVDDDADGTVDNLLATGPGELGMGNASDDVQVIPQGSGQPNQVCINPGGDGTLETVPRAGSDDTVAGTTIHTGLDGICSTAAVATDVQAIPVSQGNANQTCITPGVDGALQTTPAGDDAVLGVNIHTGANGISETTVGQQNGTDDVDLDTIAPPVEEWPDAFGLPPPPPYAGGFAVEQQAYDAEPDNEATFARQDWGDPGKNHRTIDKWDD